MSFSSRPYDKPRWLQRLLASTWGCHLVGGGISLFIVASIFLVWSHGNVAVTTVTRGEEVIDLGDAAKLISEADQWRKRYALHYHQGQAIDVRRAAIEGWLPRNADWEQTHKRVHSLARSCDVSIVSLEKSKRHVGLRVGVDAATCRVEGSYDAICRFLVAITGSKIPLACNEITVVRIPADGGREEPRPPCAATLSLRVPFAAKGSVAAQLLSAESSDAS